MLPGFLPRYGREIEKAFSQWGKRRPFALFWRKPSFSQRVSINSKGLVLIDGHRAVSFEELEKAQDAYAKAGRWERIRHRSNFSAARSRVTLWPYIKARHQFFTLSQGIAALYREYEKTITTDYTDKNKPPIRGELTVEISKKLNGQHDILWKQLTTLCEGFPEKYLRSALFERDTLAMMKDVFPAYLTRSTPNLPRSLNSEEERINSESSEISQISEASEVSEIGHIPAEGILPEPYNDIIKSFVRDSSKIQDKIHGIDKEVSEEKSKEDDRQPADESAKKLNPLQETQKFLVLGALLGGNDQMKIQVRANALTRLSCLVVEALDKLMAIRPSVNEQKVIEEESSESSSGLKKEQRQERRQWRHQTEKILLELARKYAGSIDATYPFKNKISKKTPLHRAKNYFLSLYADFLNNRSKEAVIADYQGYKPAIEVADTVYAKAKKTAAIDNSDLTLKSLSYNWERVNKQILSSKRSKYPVTQEMKKKYADIGEELKLKQPLLAPLEAYKEKLNAALSSFDENIKTHPLGISHAYKDTKKEMDKTEKPVLTQNDVVHLSGIFFTEIGGKGIKSLKHDTSVNINNKEASEKRASHERAVLKKQNVQLRGLSQECLKEMHRALVNALKEKLIEKYKADLQQYMLSFQEAITTKKDSEEIKRLYKVLEQVISTVLLPSIPLSEFSTYPQMEALQIHRQQNTFIENFCKDLQKTMLAELAVQVTERVRCLFSWSFEHSVPEPDNITDSKIYLYVDEGKLWRANRNQQGEVERACIEKERIGESHHDALCKYLLGYHIEREKFLPKATIDALYKYINEESYEMESEGENEDIFHDFYENEYIEYYFPIYQRIITWSYFITVHFSEYLAKAQQWFEENKVFYPRDSLEQLVEKWDRHTKAHPVVPEVYWNGNYRLAVLSGSPSKVPYEPGVIYVTPSCTNIDEPEIHYALKRADGQKISQQISLKELIDKSGVISEDAEDAEKREKLVTLSLLLENYQDKKIPFSAIEEALTPFVLGFAAHRGDIIVSYAKERHKLLIKTSKDKLSPEIKEQTSDMFQEVMLTQLRNRFFDKDSGLSSNNGESKIRAQHCFDYLKQLREPWTSELSNDIRGNEDAQNRQIKNYEYDSQRSYASSESLMLIKQPVSVLPITQMESLKNSERKERDFVGFISTLMHIIVPEARRILKQMPLLTNLLKETTDKFPELEKCLSQTKKHNISTQKLQHEKEELQTLAKKLERQIEESQAQEEELKKQIEESQAQGEELKRQKNILEEKAKTVDQRAKIAEEQLAKFTEPEKESKEQQETPSIANQTEESLKKEEVKGTKKSHSNLEFFAQPSVVITANPGPVQLKERKMLDEEESSEESSDDEEYSSVCR